MSSLSRRACYKCGNVGHYAEVCSSAERLCYNCKQPGHESNGCPLPRTTDAKQCYHCQGLGHVQADCPTLRLTGAAAGGRCYNCGQPGHLAVCIFFFLFFFPFSLNVGCNTDLSSAPARRPTPVASAAVPPWRLVVASAATAVVALSPVAPAPPLATSAAAPTTLPVTARRRQ